MCILESCYRKKNEAHRVDISNDIPKSISNHQTLKCRHGHKRALAVAQVLRGLLAGIYGYMIRNRASGAVWDGH